MKHLFALLLLTTTCFAFELATHPSRTVTVSVVSNDGAPVQGASVQAVFDTGIRGDPDKAGNVVTVETDADGNAVLMGRTAYPVDVSVSKEGFYVSRMEVTFSEYDETKNKAIEHDERSVTIELKPVRSPAALHAMRFEGYLPDADKDVGFDFEAGDFVAPFGSGKTSDLIFRYNGWVKSIREFSGRLKVFFVGDSDGSYDASELVYPPSELLFPHEVPDDASFNPKPLEWERKRLLSEDGKAAYDNEDPAVNYFLRIRSVKDSEGNLQQANYAKLQDGLKFDPRSEDGVCYVQFTYYFNPRANDRNLEFDPERNLFGDLDRKEQVYKP